MLTNAIAGCTILLATMLAHTAPPFEEMPKVDVHAHYFDDMPEFAKMLERINMRVVNICLYRGQPLQMQPAHEQAARIAESYEYFTGFASSFHLGRVGEPEFAEQVTAWLDRYFERGAIMTKVWKEVGMQIRLPDGSFLMPDSEELDPVYEHLTKRNKPLMAHFADPIEAWRPLREGSTHYRYFTNNPEWHMYGKEGYPSHEEISASVDRMLEKHPDLVVIGAHLGSLEHDLDALGERFDRFPNYHVDVSARTPDLRQYPAERVREFFIQYQDRILYGLDAGGFAGRPLTEAEQRAYARQMEQSYRREYEYYAGEALSLPLEVLEKFFYRNAERLLEGLK